MHIRCDTVNIGIIRKAFRREVIGNHPRRCRRTVHRCDNGNIVTRPHTAVFASVSHKGVASRTGDMAKIVREFIVCRRIAKRDVVSMDVITRSYVARRVTDKLRILAQRVALCDCLRCDLVACRDKRRRLHAF